MSGIVIPETDESRDAMTPGRWARYATGRLIPIGLANAFLAALEYGTDEGVPMSLGKRQERVG